MAKLLGEEKRKVHPKLRVLANCSPEVNAVRAEFCGSVTVDKPIADGTPVLRGLEAAAVPMDVAAQKPAPLKQIGRGVKVNVFVETRERTTKLPAVLAGSRRRGNIVTATIPLDKLPELAKDRQVLHVELGDPVTAPTPAISSRVEPPEKSRWKFDLANKHHDGKGVLIGIIDVQGFDFSHPDFRDGNKTRFVRIWDQGGAARPSPHKRDKVRFGPEFDFGAEFLEDHLNKAIRTSANGPLKLPPYEIERQSQMAAGSHGTHVASIAAGNHGVCRRASIAAVLISLPGTDGDRRNTFTDSTRIATAIDYLLAVAEELDQPISINISLGTNGHAHDGTGAINRWIDSCLSVPGRSVCVAAGNAGQEIAVSPGDLGYVMGRIHTSGQVPGRHQHKDIHWEVVGDQFVDVSENELEIWYSEQDRFAVSIRPPGKDWIGPVDPGKYIENHQLEDGTFLSVYNELYHPSNGNNYISIYLSPFFGTQFVKGIASGTWEVRLHGLDVRDGRYHGWIERDDPRRLGPLGAQQAWSFPSYFAEASNVDDSSVGSLACGRRVIAVANLATREERINITSSQGPTRDNRCKPDIAAPGTDIVAANGFGGPEDLWIAMTGTSMAAPYVAGVVGLMLACEPRLSAARLEGIIHRTSRPLPGKPYQWTNDAGFGVIQPNECLKEALLVNTREELPL